jgi:hypothetical protein
MGSVSGSTPAPGRGTSLNELGPILGAIVVALAVLLGVIVGIAAIRYHDIRFGFVAGALGALGMVGLVGLVALLWPASIPDSQLGVAPAVLIIVSEVLFYLSFVVGRRWTAPSPGR